MSSAPILFYHCFMEVFPLREGNEFSFLWGARKENSIYPLPSIAPGFHTPTFSASNGRKGAQNEPR
jgi:hypothetical protein